MRLTICHTTTSAVWADTLFVSVLQRSDVPSGDQVRKAVAAVARMRWPRAAAGEAFGRPELPVTGPRAWRLAS